jgi:G3E family GTPase
VLVNDFGAVNIDQALITGATEGVLSLENGCICCSLRGDLVDAVLKLLDRPDAPQRIVLEASGVADPGRSPAPSSRRPSATACGSTASCAWWMPSGPSPTRLLRLQMRQVGYSDLVILNKTDLAGPAQTDGRPQASARSLPARA